MIEWRRVDPDHPPEPTDGMTAFLFYFDYDVYTGWPVYDPEEGLDKRDDEGYPVWEASEDRVLGEFEGVRWYAEWNHPPGECR